MAGRITLTQSVVQAIPLYTMQSLKMPNSVCEELDRKSRAFTLYGATMRNDEECIWSHGMTYVNQGYGRLGIT